MSLLESFEDGEDLTGPGRRREFGRPCLARRRKAKFARIGPQFVDAQKRAATAIAFGDREIDLLWLLGRVDCAGTSGHDLAIGFQPPLAVGLVDDHELLGVLILGFVPVNFERINAQEPMYFLRSALIALSLDSSPASTIPVALTNNNAKIASSEYLIWPLRQIGPLNKSTAVQQSREAPRSEPAGLALSEGTRLRALEIAKFGKSAGASSMHRYHLVRHECTKQLQTGPVLANSLLGATVRPIERLGNLRGAVVPRIIHRVQPKCILAAALLVCIASHAQAQFAL